MIFEAIIFNLSALLSLDGLPHDLQSLGAQDSSGPILEFSDAAEDLPASLALDDGIIGLFVIRLECGSRAFRALEFYPQPRRHESASVRVLRAVVDGGDSFPPSRPQLIMPQPQVARSSEQGASA